MGYYTEYELSVYGAIKHDDGNITMTNSIPSVVEDLIENEIRLMNVFGDGDIKTSYHSHCKWYDHEDDMRLLSSKFPDNVFWLSGCGEDSEDMWQKFFVDGRMQLCYAKIVYDDFDVSKLDDVTPQEDNGGKYSYQVG